MIVRLQYNIKIVNPAFKTGKAKISKCFCSSLWGRRIFWERIGIGIKWAWNVQSCITFRRCYRAQPFPSFSLCDLWLRNWNVADPREQLERNISDLCITEVLSIREIRKLKSVSCDLVITTMQLDTPYYGKEVVVVDCLMTQYDIRNIENRMKQVRRRKLKTKQPCNQLHIQKNLFCEDLCIWILK